MSDLKPCPFCGGEPELEIGEIDLNGSATDDSFQYHCDNCEIFKGEFSSVEAAQKDWNARTELDEIKQLHAEREELITTLRNLTEWKPFSAHEKALEQANDLLTNLNQENKPE